MLFFCECESIWDRSRMHALAGLWWYDMIMLLLVLCPCLQNCIYLFSSAKPANKTKYLVLSILFNFNSIYIWVHKYIDSRAITVSHISCEHTSLTKLQFTNITLYMCSWKMKEEYIFCFKKGLYGYSMADDVHAM